MGWPRNLVLIRHAESEGNVLTVDDRARYDMATHEYPLTGRGRAQAYHTRLWLEKEFPDGFDVRYVSYYVRSKETMAILQPGLKVYEDPRLAEAQRGIYHSMTREEIARHFPMELERKDREKFYHYRPWGGENWPDVELRIHSFLGTLARDCEGKNVIMVVHGHWLLLFQRLIHHFSIDEAMERYKQGVFENASVTLYRGDPPDDAGMWYDEEPHPYMRLRLVEKNIIPWKGEVP